MVSLTPELPFGSLRSRGWAAAPPDLPWAGLGGRGGAAPRRSGVAQEKIQSAGPQPAGSVNVLRSDMDQPCPETQLHFRGRRWSRPLLPREFGLAASHGQINVKAAING